jgi:hypothetical protein
MATSQGISKVCHRGESRLILIGKYPMTFLVIKFQIFTIKEVFNMDLYGTT